MRKELGLEDILLENDRRQEALSSVFDPLTGEGSTGQRERVCLSDCPTPEMWLPKPMMKTRMMKGLVKAGSFSEYVVKVLNVEASDENVALAVDAFHRLRIRHDFPYWAYCHVMIKPKGAGDDIRFRLNRPQRRLVETFEDMRLNELPIRLVLLKARQWGGSTATQIYIAWLQLVHKKGMNSLIVGNQKDSSSEVRGMFDKVINAYPIELLYPIGASYNRNEAKYVGDSLTQNIHKIPQRGCKIKVGSAKTPDSARGGDATLVHCTEVAFWEKTEGKTPEQIIRSACSGTQPTPMTMVVYESTANGVGNFFQREYDAAKRGVSIFRSLFIAWYDIETYQKPFSSPVERVKFAEWLIAHKTGEHAANDREEPGKYLFSLWEKGATLEAINWYIMQRSGYSDHADMAAEYPSDDVEAFVHSGARVFDRYRVEDMRATCRAPKWRGDVQGNADDGRDALRDLHFTPDSQGSFAMWEQPEPDAAGEKITDRYLAVVDIGGRGQKADWSVVCVFDRLWMAEGGKPAVVAQWYGHTDMDRLAWKAAQIAAFYNNALLVIESNTLETKDRDRIVDGDQAPFILNQIRDVYSNLYARKQSEEEIRQGAPKKYGFHTNVATKPMVISTLVKCVREHLYTERDEACLNEFLTYERRQNGSYGAIAGKHDDLLMTRAIGLHVCFSEMSMPRIISDDYTSLNKPAISAATM